MKTSSPVVIFLAGLTLIISLGCSDYSKRFNQSKIRGSNIRSMLALKNVAISLEHYKNDHGNYPSANSMKELKKMLTPAYLDPASCIDKWGELILVSCTPDSYILSSKGDDRSGEHEFGGAVETSGHSITMKDGLFVQYNTSVEETARELESEISAAKH